MRRTGRPILALTGGDPNGVGPEICLRAALSRKVRSACRPLLVGDPSVFDFYRKRFRLPLTLVELPPGGDPALASTAVPVAGVRPVRNFRPSPGTPSDRAGLIAGASVRQAVELCAGGLAEGIVTGPLAKTTLNRAGYRFPGQTEMVARFSRSGPPLMILMNGLFRVALATAHIPLGRVPRAITRERVTSTILRFGSSLASDFGIRRPVIAVLALNPHAGEEGLLGTEDDAVVAPAVRSLRRKGIRVSGPFPADGFFGTGSHEACDGVVAMYHDQGLIPLKMSGFTSGVNFSAGLSIVRTSPGHGTAYDIAGTGKADPGSMIAAATTAAMICRNRRAGGGRDDGQ